MLCTNFRERKMTFFMFLTFPFPKIVVPSQLGIFHFNKILLYKESTCCDHWQVLKLNNSMNYQIYQMCPQFISEYSWPTTVSKCLGIKLCASPKPH